jgi:hypothetical protein
MAWLVPVMIAGIALLQTITVEWLRRRGRGKALYCPKCGARKRYDSVGGE